MAQLDRLGPARTVAQVAAVIGREFNKELLTAILHQPESTIEATLDQLRAADVIVAHGAGQSQSLAFRHALLRDAAYESLVLRTRRHWHARVAETYQQKFPEVTTSQPELVARHWTDAGHSDAALPLWFDAGRKAANRFANAEAISHFHAGLDLLREQADTDDRRQQELAFLTELGLVLRVSRGYGHPELEQIYRRASELCSDLGDVEALAKNIFGLWTFAAAHADWRETDALVEKFTALSKSQSDDQLHVERWRLQGVSAVFQGRFEAAATALKTSFSHYDPARHGPRFGFDPGPTVLIYLSWAAFHLGNTAEAEAYAARAVALAEEKGHAPTMALVMTWQILYLAAKKNWTSVKQVSSSLDKLCTEKGFPQWRPLGNAFGLFADFLENKDPAAIDGMLAAAEAFRGYWGGFLIPCFWITAAEACWIAEMVDRGHELLDAAEAFQSAHGEYLWKDELKRVQGLFRTEEPALKVTLPRSGGARSLPGLSPPADQSKA
jgi:tetratricopeptide (TPR) repeat protein